MAIHQMEPPPDLDSEDPGEELTGEKRASPTTTRSRYEIQDRISSQERMNKKLSDKNLRSPTHTQSNYGYTDSDQSGPITKILSVSNSPSLKDGNELQQKITKARRPGQIPKKTPSLDDSLVSHSIPHIDVFRVFYAFITATEDFTQ